MCERVEDKENVKKLQLRHRFLHSGVVFFEWIPTKQTFFKFLLIGTEKLIITTQGPIVFTNHPIDISDLSPCSHEEADTRMMVHLAHAEKDHNKIIK